MMQIENWRGLWNLLTTYAVNDIAYYEGSSYFALDINTGKAPILANIGVYWSPVALAGEQGIQGQQGVIGPTGIQGVPGIQGPAGNPGIQGIQGNQGDRGPEGLPGIKGDTGSQGIQGVKGDTGIQGVPGVQGVKGDIGDTGQGLVWRNTWEAIATYNTYDCVSYEGASYICLAPNVLNVSPDSDDSKWGLLAQGGGTIDWSEIKDVPTTVAGYGITDLSPVATSGSYNDLNNKPTLGTAAAQNISAFDAAGSAATVQTNLTAEVSRATTAEGLLVLKTTTVNGHALSANVVVSASDITTGTLPVAQLPTIPYSDLSGTPTIPTASSTTPGMDGTAAIGSLSTFAKADHVHPSDTNRVATSTTVNGHALTGNVVVSASDLTTGTTLTSISNATFTTATGMSATLGTAATGTPVIGIWNPSTSTINAVILQATLNVTLTALTATGAGGFVWGVFAGNGALTVGNAPINRKTLTAGGSQCKNLSGLALTGLTNVGVVVAASTLNGGPIYNVSEVGTAAGFHTVALTSVENLDGSIILPPGGVLALFATTTPVALSAVGSLLWEEVPV